MSVITLKTNRKPYSDIIRVSSKAVVYKEVFMNAIGRIIDKNLGVPNACEGMVDIVDMKKCVSDILSSKKILWSFVYGLGILTKKLFQTTPREDCTTACIFLTSGKFKVISKNKKKYINYGKGSVLILGKNFRKSWRYVLPDDCIVFYEKSLLPKMYLNVDARLKFSEKVKKLFEPIRSKPLWKQCAKDYMQVGKLLGKGSYGNVYKSEYKFTPFAIKFAKLKPEAIEKAYDISNSSWHEVYIMKNILNAIIKEKICPNFPLLSTTVVCGSCELDIDGEKKIQPCVSTVLEYANGTLKDWFKKCDNRRKENIPEIYSILFQIMVAVHAIQSYGQIMNYDIKKENILYFDVEAGGYWKYTVLGEDYYIPNFGKMFVLNDFGISRTMSPDFPMYRSKSDNTYRLGCRYGVVDAIGETFIPLSVKTQTNGDLVKEKCPSITIGNKTFTGAEYRLNKKGVLLPTQDTFSKEALNALKEHNIKLPTESKTNFFEKPNIVPPFEFFNDTQDVIRIFTGGKRTTQKGYHSVYKVVPKSVIAELKPYLGKSKTMSDKVFSDKTFQVLAGSFIKSFFGKYGNFKKGVEKDEILESYVVS